MKKLPLAGMMLLATSLLAACDGGGTAPSTHDLTVTLSGVTSAPVKVTNTTSNTVVFDGRLDTTKTFTGIAANSVLKVEGGAINNYATPAAQTITLDSNKTVTLAYTAAQAQTLNPARYTGQVQPWTFSAGQIAAYFLETKKAMMTSPAAISTAGAFDAALPTPTNLVSLMGGCTFSGTRTVTDIQTITANPVVLSPAGDYLGDLIETDVNGHFVVRQYSDRDATFKGAVACSNGEKYSLDVKFVKGWNAVAVSSNSATQTTTVTSVPAGSSTKFTFEKAQENLSIYFKDESALTLNAGEQVSRAVTLFQNGGINGDISFTTNVPGVTVKPVSLKFNPLSALSLTAQGMDTTFVFEAGANAQPYQGELIVSAMKNGVKVGEGRLPSFTLNVPHVMPTLPTTSTVQVAQGETQDVTFTLYSQSGFSGATTVTLTNLPTGVSASTATVNLTVGGSANVTIQVKATSAAPLGYFTATITGPKVRTIMGGTTSISMAVTPARVLLPFPATQTAPASDGVWFLGGSSVDASGATVTPLIRVSSSVAQQVNLSGTTRLLPSPNNDALTISEVYNAGYVDYTVRRIGVTGEISSFTTRNSQDGQNFDRGAVDGSGFLWFLRSTLTQAGTTGVLAKLNVQTGAVTEISTPVRFSGNETMYASPDGKTIIIPDSGNTSVIHRVNTTTGVVTSSTFTTALYAAYGSPQLVGNDGTYYVATTTQLARVDSTGAVNLYSAPEGLSVKLIGFDRVNPGIIWLESGSQLMKFDTSSKQFTAVTPLTSSGMNSYKFGAPSGTGGVGVVVDEQYLSNGNYSTRSYVSFVK